MEQNPFWSNVLPYSPIPLKRTLFFFPSTRIEYTTSEILRTLFYESLKILPVKTPRVWLVIFVLWRVELFTSLPCLRCTWVNGASSVLRATYCWLVRFIAFIFSIFKQALCDGCHNLLHLPDGEPVARIFSYFGHTSYFLNDTCPFLNFPRYFSNPLLKNEADATPHPDCLDSGAALFLYWLHNHMPSLNLWLSHNVGCHSPMALHLWCPPSAQAGGQNNIQSCSQWSSHTNTLISMTLFPVGLKIKLRDLRPSRRTLTMQDPCEPCFHS